MSPRGEGGDGRDGVLGRSASPRAPQSPLLETLRPDQTLQLDTEAVTRYREARLQGTLLVIDGLHADVGSHLVVVDEVVIGREPAGLQLRDGRISRRHARVRRVDNSCEINDLSSTNGTLVNGVRVEGQRPLADGDKILVGNTLIKFTLVDETEARYLRRMERLAGTDALTGLLAKHRFDSLLQEAVRFARATSAPLSMMMMDLDGIKAINDAHGHQLGERTITEVGRLLGRRVNPHAEACRFGGDEFCFFLRHTSLERAEEVAEQIRGDVRQLRVTVDDVTVRVTISISIGIAELTAEMASADELMAHADRALYRAKAAGKNAVCR